MTALHVLLNQHGRNGSKYLKLHRPNSGIIMMLLILFMPIAIFSIKYSQKLFERREKMLVKADGPFYRKYYTNSSKVALAVAKKWNPGQTLENQSLDPVYEEVFNSGVWCKNSALGGAIDGIILSDSSTTDDTSAPTTNGPADAPTTSAEKAAYAKKEIAIAIENDKIKVTFEKTPVYALPAECNLDLVLAIPTNSDAAVEEIGQASANFLKDNFYNMRGVYASVIPYSGKLSLPADRYEEWTEAFPNFSYSTPVTLHSLYGTSSVSGTTGTVYNSSGANNGCSIMYRANLFDSTNADTSKYKRMNIKPCTSFVFSLDSGITSSTYTAYTANPHAIIEPAADLSTAYTKCNGLTQPSDTKNTSSFSFAALEWANNMFLDWTTDPQISAVAGKNNGILSSQSKTAAGRKKAILLIVNKTDTFANEELTYLGLSNDADERNLDLDWKETTLPSARSWISVCYGGGKFVAITYNSNIAAYSNDGVNWIQSTMPSVQNWASICYGGGKFVAIAYDSNVAAYSSDGIDWTQSTLPISKVWTSLCYGNGKFITVSGQFRWAGSYCYSDEVAYSSDGETWIQSSLPTKQNWTSVYYGGDKFVTVSSEYYTDAIYYYYSNVAAYSSDGINWTQSTLPKNDSWGSVCYGGGKFVAVGMANNYSQAAAYSSDGINWTQSILPSKGGWQSVCYGGGKFVAVGTGVAAYSSDGINWTQFTMPSSKYWHSVCYGDGKFVAVASGYTSVATYGEFVVKTNTIGNKALKDALDDGTTSGVTTLTTNACNKLKEAYGDDIRIDIVKYKASGTDDDYQYLKDCAESTGGKLHSAEDETALKSTLDTIAADLKSWAGYQEARIVN